MAMKEQIKKKRKKKRVFSFCPANVGCLPNGMLQAGALVRRTILGGSSPAVMSLQAVPAFLCLWLWCQFKQEGWRALL